jgi:uncharacterized LabA/DUF88 family protein
MPAVKQRVIVYIDGFNLYFGIRDAKWRRYLWLNVEQLARNLLKDNQELTEVKYFTALVRGKSSDTRFLDKQRRQNVYLDALRTIPNLSIILGKYQLGEFHCPSCGATSMVPTEKMTDVNISVAMLEDAITNLFDTAILISGDGDLAPAVRSVRLKAASKRVVAAFPPRRSAFELKDAADSSFTIGRRKLAKSQFPTEVTTAAGHILRKPTSWAR